MFQVFAVLQFAVPRLISLVQRHPGAIGHPFVAPAMLVAAGIGFAINRRRDEPRVVFPPRCFFLAFPTV